MILLVVRLWFLGYSIFTCGIMNATLQKDFDMQARRIIRYYRCRQCPVVDVQYLQYLLCNLVSNEVCQELLSSVDNHGWALIHYASLYDDIMMLRFLRQRSVDFLQKTFAGATALNIAEYFGSQKALAFLEQVYGIEPFIFRKNIILCDRNNQ